jgi:hypothetical protein
LDRIEWIHSFGAENIASPFPASIPLSTGANNWLAPLLADLNFNGTSNPAECYYYFNSDSFIISFIDVPFWENTTTGYTGKNSFQIILSQLDSSITFNYKDTDMGNLTTIDNIVGIENVTGSLGLSTYIDVLPPDVSTIKYYYPAVVNYAVTDAGMQWNDNLANGGIFLGQGSPAYALVANVKNLGNQTVSNFIVRDTVYNQSSTVISSGTANVSSLSPGQLKCVVFFQCFQSHYCGNI